MQCTAHKRNGEPCRKFALKGSTVCRLHGGKAGRPIVTGRYSKVLAGALRAKMDELDHDDPDDLLPELQIQRAMFADYIGRFQEGVKLSGDDIYRMMQWADAIGKQVERIAKIKTNAALTAVEIKFLQTRIVDTVIRYIDDPQRQQAFISELFGITGNRPEYADALEATTGDS